MAIKQVEVLNKFEPNTSVLNMETKTKKDFSLFIFVPFLILLVNIALHLGLTNNQEQKFRYAYTTILIISASLYAVLTFASLKYKSLHEKLKHFTPLIAVAVSLVEVWDLLTLKFALLPLPYFPGPDKVFGVFKEDWLLMLTSLFYSLRLMIVAYIIGTVLGLITGISVGWSEKISYWVMPVLKIIGPIPATAWIPIAMIVFPTTFWSSIFLIVLAVWFPVTVMTSSGISSVRNSYFEVARTLGADNKYLIFKVAIPAAYPNIFIGLFMGMGSSFLTLIVAEMLGVKAGLGWYINWAQGWAEYSKVYACLIVIAFIFSSLLTLLFKIKDKVLIWQKGLIKW